MNLPLRPLFAVPAALAAAATVRRRTIFMFCSLAGLSLVPACGTNLATGPAATPVITATSLVLALPTAPPTVAGAPSATLDLDSAVLTKIAPLQTRAPAIYATAYTDEVQRAQRMAQSMLTPYPSYIPVLPPGYLTATPEVGVVECVIARQGDPWPHNCWRGYLNGQLVLVEAGTPPGDKAHGIVWIVGDGQDENGVPWYAAPQAVKGLRILAVTGTRMLLAPVVPQSPPITFTFDLATRQWIGPDGTPLPTPTVTPRATVLP